jgi:CheY-like chemotaxis protein
MDLVRILVVDDEEDFLETLVNRLNRRGMSAQGALSGREALKMMEEKEFDVVVLDVRMPGMDGLEVLRR